MFRYICNNLREFQFCTSLKLRSFNIIKMHYNYQIKIFMWFLLLKCSLYNFYNIFFVLAVYLRGLYISGFSCVYVTCVLGW